MKVYLLLLLFLFGGTGQAAAITQITEGSYSPAVAEVGGNVNIAYQCADPEDLHRFHKLLDKFEALVNRYDFLISAGLTPFSLPIIFPAILNVSSPVGRDLPWLHDSKSPVGLTNLFWPSGSDPTLSYDSKITIGSYPGSLSITAAAIFNSSGLLGSDLISPLDFKSSSIPDFSGTPMSGFPPPLDVKNLPGLKLPGSLGGELTSLRDFKSPSGLNFPDTPVISPTLFNVSSTPITSYASLDELKKREVYQGREKLSTFCDILQRDFIKPGFLIER